MFIILTRGRGCHLYPKNWYRFSLGWNISGITYMMRSLKSRLQSSLHIRCFHTTLKGTCSNTFKYVFEHIRTRFDRFFSINFHFHSRNREQGPLLTAISIHFVKKLWKLYFSICFALMILIRNVIQLVHNLQILQMAVSRHISCIEFNYPFLKRNFLVTVRQTIIKYDKLRCIILHKSLKKSQGSNLWLLLIWKCTISIY